MTEETRDALRALALIITLIVALAGCVEHESSMPAPTAPLRELPIQYGYRIVNAYPHDPSAFTQGLVCENGYFYEGTGGRGESRLRKVDRETGEVLKEQQLPAQYFGEGITIWGDSIIQITYRSQIGFVYDKETFQLRRNFSYVTDGWGLTHDGKHLIIK
jgi:glutamine cyclotransferase